MASSTRSAKNNVLRGIGFVQNTSDGSDQQIFPVQQSKQSLDILIYSRGNKKIRGKYRGGDDFACAKQSMDLGKASLSQDLTQFEANNGKTYSYSGDYAATGPENMDYYNPKQWSENEIKALGTLGFNRTIPTKPQAQVTQALAELRDLPKLPTLNYFRDRAKTFRSLARNSGKEYLNVQFGWNPFVNDVKKATVATLKAKKNSRDFVANSGKLVRRSCKLGSNSETYLGDRSMRPWPTVLGLAYGDNDGVRETQTLTYKDKCWFVGYFTYYIPGSDDKWYSKNSIARGENIVNHMYGTRITPETLWNLAPWSWMADYFGNVGGIIQNFSNFASENLVCHSAFLMCSSSSTYTYSLPGLNLANGKKLPAVTAKTVSKNMLRRKADPYGFAVNFDLNPKQLAILGALGLSRS